MNNLTGERIKEIRQLRGFSQEELGKKIGVQKAAIHKYESGIVVNLKRSIIEKLADALQCSPIYLLGIEDDQPDGTYSKLAKNPLNRKEYIHDPNLRPAVPHRIPKLGSTAAGIPASAQYVDEYLTIPYDIDADYCLDIHGSSMFPLVEDGGVVFLKLNQQVHDGDIVVVRIDNDTTLKRLYRSGDTVRLEAINPKFSPIYLSNSDYQDTQVLGKAVGFYRPFPKNKAR